MNINYQQMVYKQKFHCIDLKKKNTVAISSIIKSFCKSW